MSRYRYGWRPYVPVAKRRRKSAKAISRLMKVDQEISPVEIDGRRIAATFWGQAWCDNLEAYSDFANRLPRGRTYVRNGSVIHLSVEPGRVHALVMGTDLYRVDIGITPLTKPRWTEVKRRCAGAIDSLVELLRGSLSKGVMEVVTRRGKGLFPSPQEITLSCSCPDWAVMCKHVAAALYGVGARLDQDPEKLFTLRGVDPVEMVEAAVRQPPGGGSPRGPVLASGDLSSVFGIEIDTAAEDPGPAAAKVTRKKATGRKAKKKKKAAGKKAASKKKLAAKKAVSKKKAIVKKAASKKKKVTARKAAPKRKVVAKKRASKKKAVGKKAAVKKAASRKKKIVAKKTALKKTKTAARKAPSKKKVAGKKGALKKKAAAWKATPRKKKAAVKKVAKRRRS